MNNTSTRQTNGKATVVLNDAIRVVREFPGDTEWLALALSQRADIGKAKYGDYLRVHAGANAAEEYLNQQLDAVMYATQAYLESPSYATRELIRVAVEACVMAKKLTKGEMR